MKGAEKKEPVLLKTREKGMLKSATNGRYYYRIHSGGRQH